MLSLPSSPQPYLVVFTCERPNREPRWFWVPISVWQLTAELVAPIRSHTLEFSSSQISWNMPLKRNRHLQESKKYHYIKGKVHLKMRIHLFSIMPTQSWVKFSLFHIARLHIVASLSWTIEYAWNFFSPSAQIPTLIKMIFSAPFEDKISTIAAKLTASRQHPDIKISTLK